MTATVELRLLGSFRVVSAGADVRQPPPRTQGLLAQLALAGGPVLRDDLACAQLPDEPIADARRQVSQRLFQLRRALPELPLTSDLDAVRLDPERCRTDVAELEAAAGSEDLETRLAALARYRGPFLAGVDGEWAAQRRREYEDTFLALARDTTRRLLERRRHDEAVALLRRVVDEFPLAEHDLALLAEVLDTTGRRDEALTVLQGFVDLSEEVGIRPRERTLRLVAAVREGRPPGDAAGGIDPSPQPPRELWEAIAATAWKGDFRDAEQRLREARRDGEPAEDLRIAEAHLALARDDAVLACERLSACDDDDPRVMLLRASLLRLEPDGAAGAGLAARALLATGLTDDDRLRFDALHELARSRGVAGLSRRALESTDAALALARSGGGAARVARALYAKGAELHRQARYDEARPLLHDALAIADQHGLAILAAHVNHSLGTLANLQADLERALELQVRELSRWRDLALDRHEAIALCDLSSTQIKLGDVGAALGSLDLAASLAEDVGHPVVRARVRLMRAYAMAAAGDTGHADALALTHEGLDLLGNLAQDVWETGALFTLRGYLRYGAGDAAGGLEDTDRAIASWEARGEPELIPRALATRGLCLAALGRSKEALAATEEAVLTVLERTAEDDHVAIFHHIHGMVLAESGYPDDARRYVVHAWRLLRDLLLVVDPARRPSVLTRDPSTRLLVRTVREWGIADPDETLRLDLPQPPTPQPEERSPRRTHTPEGVAQRRAELAGIMSRTTAEGLARPNVAELARRLGVSQRTVKRDLAALRGLASDGPRVG